MSLTSSEASRALIFHQHKVIQNVVAVGLVRLSVHLKGRLTGSTVMPESLLKFG